jgi:glutamate N-acetyltransferase/amino-acid N-acetyltransferase
LKLPLGYRYAALYAGIRKQEKPDVALIVPERPAQAAGLFTRNVVQAAPVQLARKNLKASRGKIAALLVNAGNANCATRSGEQVALASCKSVAKALKTRPEFVVSASTGVIGVELDAKLLIAAVPKLIEALSPGGFEDVARAILTTDTRMKTASDEIHFKAGSVRVAGMTKGAGMIHPDMATMLGFVMTDATVRAEALREMITSAAQRSFHSLTIDGDTSTNDSLLLMASGAANVTPSSKELKVLLETITRVMESLAQQIAADGEGARKLIVIKTSGFKNEEEARRVARAVANSPLVKTAVAGSDANWGRILTAAGYSGVAFAPNDIDIELQGMMVCQGGLAAEFHEDEMKKKLDETEVHIRVLNKRGGKGEARYFTCDLTEGYIDINGRYRT